ncbi:hypothetical protein [Streptomyces sp. NPDC029526]|uniref:hypothetical protein n=1 Tax=Streptomyces sp. NPDC029526 TaxID=3155728 RepID=UPI0033D02F95
MKAPETSRFVRLRVELVLEVGDEGAVTEEALARIARDADLPAAERAHAEAAVTDDTAEALAHLVDPFALVGEVPGVELHQASWSGERIDYDPDSHDWDVDGEDGDASFEEDDDSFDFDDEAYADDAADADDEEDADFAEAADDFWADVSVDDEGAGHGDHGRGGHDDSREGGGVRGVGAAG